jgi:hypothetical protein
MAAIIMPTLLQRGADVYPIPSPTGRGEYLPVAFRFNAPYLLRGGKGITT